MMRCNLSKLSGTEYDTQFRVHVVFISAILNVDQHGINMACVSYFNIKRSGETLVGVRNTPHICQVEYAKISRHDMMRDANMHMDGIFIFLTFFYKTCLSELQIGKYELCKIRHFLEIPEKRKRYFFSHRAEGQAGWLTHGTIGMLTEQETLRWRCRI